MVLRVPDLSNAQGDYAALDDRMLVLDFQAGHPEAFVEIHRRYGGLARHVCGRFLPNAHDADDALQETMVRVFQGLYRFNGQYSLQPWIARIATNISLDVLRGRARRPVVDPSAFEDDEREDPSDGPEQLVDRLVERDRVLSVLSDLPESHRRALVLRELEGASHREIAHAMGITPAQAKALIHRAKDGFRRRWLIAVTEKGGLMGIAALPLLWLAKAMEVFRRVADRAGHASQVAQLATPEVVTSAASSSAMPMAVSSIGDRVVAAGMTLLLAGGVTVGAATFVKKHSDAERVDPIVAAAPVAPPALPDPAPAEAPVAEPAQHDGRGGEGHHHDADPGAEVPPVVDEPIPDPSVDPSPAPDPSESPPPEPPPTETPPPIPPAPDWSGSFAIDWPSVDTCLCAPGIVLGESLVDGILGEETELSVEQSFTGALSDAEGNAAWAVDAAYQAELGLDNGTFELRFSLTSNGEVHTYVASAVNPMLTGTPGGQGKVAYWFLGRYELTEGDPDTAPIPSIGRVNAWVHVWEDGSTPFQVEIALARSN